MRVHGLAIAIIIATTAIASAQPLPAPAPDDTAARMEQAQFSGKRFVVEILAGGAIGSLATYATYSSLCDRGDCLGATLASFGMNFAVTPLVTYGVGRWMGGDGTLGWTYLGATTALAPFGVTGPANESPADTSARLGIELAVSAIVLPVTSALFYELSSHLHYKQWRATAGVAPVYGQRHRLDGALGQLALTF